MKGKLFHLVALCIIGFPVFSQSILIKPYLQDLGTNQTTIMWETDSGGKGFVDWGNTPFTLSNSVVSENQTGSGSATIHAAIIQDILPGTKYYYRIRSQSGETSYAYHFRTLEVPENEQPVQLIAISDMQQDGGNPNVFRSIIEDGMIPIIQSQIDTALTSLEAVLIPGDLVQTGGNYASWRTTFFAPSDRLTPYVPIYPVPGNHEYSGGGLPNFIKYFSLPENGPASLIEQAWYKDISNIRIIGLNSNSGAVDQDTQLEWLQSILDSTCTNNQIDFVFAQLHHPFKSELWLPGESSFTGEVIDQLETFTASCGKASIHFFGHTHGYSRGQSRDHKHLWVNVATAGGNIDYWGEFANADYPEFNVSQDEYGFVLVSSEAGEDPSFTLKRYTRGDEFVSKNNELIDEITVKNNTYPPVKPELVFPLNDTLGENCLTLKASAFFDPGLSQQASHWQIARGCDFIDSLVSNEWLQHENWYDEVDRQAGDDLTDFDVENVQPGYNYCWRVRYRNEYLAWSDWSAVGHFYVNQTGGSLTGNFIRNSGAEDETINWTGDIESLLSDECNSVPAFAGQSLFGVGGICSNEMTVGLAHQDFDASTFANQIDADSVSLFLSGYLRDFSGSDVPEMYAEFYNSQSQLIQSMASISNASASWTKKSVQEDVPIGCRMIRIVLKGTRNAGSDNDSYFDALFAQLLNRSECVDCFTSQSNMDDFDSDGFCADLDCNDQDDKIYPGAAELCDQKDNNCDGKTDSLVAVWTGLGDGVSWNQGENWNQGFTPLPCQHAKLNLNDSVSIINNPTIKSLEIGNLAVLGVHNGATLTVLGEVNQNISTVSIKGRLTNHGRCHLFPTAEDTLLVDGQLVNDGSIIIHGSGIHELKVLAGGSIVNTSLLDLNDE